MFFRALYRNSDISSSICPRFPFTGRAGTAEAFCHFSFFSDSLLFWTISSQIIQIGYILTRTYRTNNRNPEFLISVRKDFSMAAPWTNDVINVFFLHLMFPPLPSLWFLDTIYNIMNNISSHRSQVFLYKKTG